MKMYLSRTAGLVLTISLERNEFMMCSREENYGCIELETSELKTPTHKSFKNFNKVADPQFSVLGIFFHDSICLSHRAGRNRVASGRFVFQSQINNQGHISVQSGAVVSTIFVTSHPLMLVSLGQIFAKPLDLTFYHVFVILVVKQSLLMIDERSFISRLIWMICTKCVSSHQGHNLSDSIAIMTFISHILNE